MQILLIQTPEIIKELQEMENSLYEGTGND